MFAFYIMCVELLCNCKFVVYKRKITQFFMSQLFIVYKVVQVYITWPSTKLPAPKIQLVAFGRYFIAKNEGISCQFHVSLEQLAVWDDNSKSYTTVTGNSITLMCMLNRAI